MGIEVREQCVFVRVETGATAWGLTEAGARAIASTPWIHLELGLTGLHGVAPADGSSWPERVGGWVRDEDGLADVEVCEGMSLVTSDGPLAELASGLTALRARVRAVFAHPGGCAVVIERDAAGELVARVRG